MGWMKGYQFMAINKSINNMINISKEIRIISFNINRKDICKDLHIGIYDNHNMIEDFYINPRKKITIKSKYLNDTDKEVLIDYFSINGMTLLEYQLYKINYSDIKLKV